MAREITDVTGVTERANAVILVVEDSESTLRLEQLVLEHAGFEVVAARTGETALEILEETNPALVLLDIHLPRMDGFATCESIRRSSQVPVIIITADNRDEDKVKGLEMGADDFITKPFSITELAARVRAVIRRYDTRSAGPATDPSPAAGLDSVSPPAPDSQTQPPNDPLVSVPPENAEGTVEGTVKIIAATSENIANTVHFVDQLRQIPHFHVLRLQKERQYEKLVISLRLREPIPLKSLLLGLEGVSRVEVVDVPADESPDKENASSFTSGFEVFLD